MVEGEDKNVLSLHVTTMGAFLVFISCNDLLVKNNSFAYMAPTNNPIVKK